MFLEKLEIQGFKSFANKNTLVFPGMISRDKRGITVIVGPNGSGKSNVADAVRWALGEQSMKTLRGKKSEDIIFSGSDKKGKLGMAEVSLFLNNEDGKAPVDYSQIVLTRRLYRDGESEYLINNNRVRLSDVQMLLAKASFGQKTYSVIGQGMVEGFINTSLAERKEFFDEATGVKQYQIKRDDSLNKLRSSYENLVQTQVLLNEIEPRLKSLTRQVHRLQKREELEKELKEMQLDYYSYLWHDINQKFNNFNEQYLELQKNKAVKDKKLDNLNSELEQLKIESARDNNFDKLQNELTGEQRQKDEITRKLARLSAQMEIKLEEQGQFDLSFLLNKKEEIVKEIAIIKEEIENIEQIVSEARSKGNMLAQERQDLERQIRELNEKINILNKELIQQSPRAKGGDLAKVNNDLNRILKRLKDVIEESDIDNVKKIIQEIEVEIKKMLNEEDGEEEKQKHQAKEAEWQAVRKQIEKMVSEKEELMNRIGENNLKISSQSERMRLLKEKHSQLDNELQRIEGKINQKSENFDFGKLEQEQKELNKELAIIEEKISEIKEKVKKVNSAEEEKRNKLFALQRELHNLQNEINVLNNQLSDIKINSTRYETRLEDLEAEIREELGGLRKVREYKVEKDLAMDELKGKILQIKKQLELIGGIDPQIESEYKETKERFDFLSGQVDDFIKTVESLEKIIKALDITIKEKFDQEFKEIAQNFEKYFKILFNGGNAKIIKVMEDVSAKSEGEEEIGKPKQIEEMGFADVKKVKILQKHNATGLAGIEIQATPPGKKIRAVSMLSGGERALTAIALICAIISSNPSPFVFLDEVDAALDEANSERLANILDELSHKTQFITITHNRASMRKANILYGVTMGDDGVSKLISVKLDEVKAR